MWGGGVPAAAELGRLQGQGAPALGAFLPVGACCPAFWLSTNVCLSARFTALRPGIMLHLLDCPQAPLEPKAPGPPGGWQAWARGALQRLPGLSNMPLSEQEVRTRR